MDTNPDPNDLFVAYAATRDRELRDILITQNMPLAKYVATKMFKLLPDGTDKEDVTSMALLGLIDSVDKYDPGTGFKFSSYAVVRIRGSILDGMQREEWAPKSIAVAVRKYKRAVVDLASELGRDATDEELAVHLELAPAEIRQLRQESTRVRVRQFSDLPGGDEGASDMYEHEDSDDSGIGAPAYDAEQDLHGEMAEIGKRIASTLGDLTPAEVGILLLHHRDNLTLKEAGARIGLSSARAFATHAALMDRTVQRLRDWYGETA